MGTKAAPAARSRAAGARIQSTTQSPVWLWLALIWLISAAVHFLWLRTEAQFPLLATDEVQYIATGENLRLGHGFTARGEFHAGIPPLYPMFVAFAHSLGGDPRTSALWWSCVAISLAVFPAFALARHIGLDWKCAYLLGAAAAFLPNTLWAGLYMAETLSYPLFVAAFWAFAVWVESPGVRRALLAGALLSAMLLTKVSAWSFAGAVLATAIILLFSPKRLRPPAGFAVQAGWIVLLVAASQLAWQAFKFSHHAAGFGMYGRSLSDSGGLPRLSVSMLLAYLGDFLLAPGVVAAVPLWFWFRENLSRRFALAVLLAAVLLSQLGVHGTLETGLTGWLKERLIFNSFPIIAIFAAAGIAAVRGRVARLLFVAAPLGLLWLALRYPFPYNPALDIPWASALGSFAWKSLDTFSRAHLVRGSAIAVVLIALLALAIPARRIAVTFAVFALSWNVLLFASSSKEMAELSIRGRGGVARLVGWLTSAGVRPDDRLIICGNLAFFQESSRSTLTEPFFMEWHRRFGLGDIVVTQIETYGRYDVRMARNPEEIGRLMRPGDHLLAATRVSNLELVSEQYPFYLYTRKAQEQGTPRPLYAIDITADLEVHSAEQTQVLLGSPVSLLAGRYRASVSTENQGGETLLAEAVNTAGGQPLAGRQIASPATELEFSTDGGVPVQFRLRGPGISRHVFRDVEVQYAGPLVSAVPPGGDTGSVLREPENLHAEPGAELPFLCDVTSVNGAVSAPEYFIRSGDRLEMNWWAEKAARLPGVPWLELSSDTAGTYYVPTGSSPPDVSGMQAIRASASTAALPAAAYRATIIRVDGSRRLGCLQYRNVTITPGGGR